MSTNQYGKNRPLYTARQLQETQRILAEQGYTLAFEAINIRTYTNPNGWAVTMQLYSPRDIEPNNGILTFFSPLPGAPHKTIGMWDFVKRENAKAARPGLRFLTRVVEEFRNM